MGKKLFVAKDSIVRKIWGRSDTILFIFAGGAAEFALNKSVDWLYYTGRLPSDPVGRLFSTVSYAQAIIFSEECAAHRAIDSMNRIHGAVESDRGMKIPDWAYRDVLFMLIDYSIRSFELLYRTLTFEEKKDVFNVFMRVGNRMNIPGLPDHFEKWRAMRDEHLQKNLCFSDLTRDLFEQYKKHLGPVRYRLLIGGQTLVAPGHVKALLSFKAYSPLQPVVSLYKFSRLLQADHFVRSLVLPPGYRRRINELEMTAPKLSMSSRKTKLTRPCPTKFS